MGKTRLERFKSREDKTKHMELCRNLKTDEEIKEAARLLRIEYEDQEENLHKSSPTTPFDSICRKSRENHYKYGVHLHDEEEKAMQFLKYAEQVIGRPLRDYEGKLLAAFRKARQNGKTLKPVFGRKGAKPVWVEAELKPLTYKDLSFPTKEDEEEYRKFQRAYVGRYGIEFRDKIDEVCEHTTVEYRNRLLGYRKENNR